MSTTGPGPFIEPDSLSVTQQQYVPNTLLVFQVVSYQTNAIDPDSGIPEGNADFIVFQAYANNQPQLGIAPLYIDTSALTVGLGAIGGVPYTSPAFFGGGGGASPPPLIQFGIANLEPQDVGATAAFEVIGATNTQPVSGHSLTVNNGGEEGSTVSISIPTVNTQALGISDISIQSPETENFMNLPTGPSSSNQIPAYQSEYLVDNAIDTVNQIRAQVGAQTVSLQQDANNDNVAIVNYTASVSNIRDANVGQTVTDFTKNQILAQVGTAVLAQLQVSATQLTALLLNSYAGLA